MPFCCAIGGGSHVTVAERELLATATKFCGYDVGTVEGKETFRLHLHKLLISRILNCSEYSEWHRTRSMQLYHRYTSLNVSLHIG